MAAKARVRLDGADPINRGLLRFLPLTDGAGEQLLDISPARRNGATVGSTTRPTTQRGKALGVSSGTNYGLVRSGAVVSGLRAYTVSFWVQTAASAAFTNGGAFYCERASSGNDILKVEGLGFGSGFNVAFFTMRDDGGTLLQGFGSTVINDGRAHLCTFVKNGSSILYYVDGKADISSTWSGSDSFTNSGLESRIASDPADPLAFTNGNFTNLRLFSRALLPQEIQRLYRDPWAGTARPVRRAVAVPGTQYTLATDALAYEHTVGDAGLGWGRWLDTEALAYEHAVGDAGFVVRRTLQAEAVAYRYTVPAVALNYYPAQVDGDTHDGFKRRSRRQRALDAAERRRREAVAQEAVTLRLSLEAAMGMAAEVVEEAPAEAVEAVQAVARKAARLVPTLADTRADEALLASAREAVAALRAAVDEAARAKALAEDDEDVLMLLRAL